MVILFLKREKKKQILFIININIYTKYKIYNHLYLFCSINI